LPGKPTAQRTHTIDNSSAFSSSSAITISHSAIPSTNKTINIRRFVPADHFIGCTAAPHFQWQTQLLSATSRQLAITKTNPDLQEAILNVINRAIAGRPISVGGAFTVALRAQEQIGWQSMLQGYWESEWQTAYFHTFATPEEETPTDRSKRLTNMD
jgi:hypothetical protein